MSKDQVTLLWKYIMATTKNVRYNIRLLVGNSSQETLQQQLKKHAVKKKYSGVYLMYLKLSDTKI